MVIKDTKRVAEVGGIDSVNHFLKEGWFIINTYINRSVRHDIEGEKQIDYIAEDVVYIMGHKDSK